MDPSDTVLLVSAGPTGLPVHMLNASDHFLSSLESSHDV